LKEDAALLKSAIHNYRDKPKQNKHILSELLDNKYNENDFKEFCLESLKEFRASLGSSVLEKAVDDINHKGYRPGQNVPTTTTTTTVTNRSMAPRSVNRPKTDYIVALSGIVDVFGEHQFSEIYKETDHSVKQFKQKRKRDSLEDQALGNHDDNNNNNAHEAKKRGGVFANMLDEGTDEENQHLPDTLEKKVVRYPLVKASGYRGRIPWTSLEVKKLYYSVALFGAGKWQRMLAKYSFGDRTAVDLKDKWRNLQKLATHEADLQRARLAIQNQEYPSDLEEEEQVQRDEEEIEERDEEKEEEN